MRVFCVFLCACLLAYLLFLSSFNVTCPLSMPPHKACALALAVRTLCASALLLAQAVRATNQTRCCMKSPLWCPKTLLPSFSLNSCVFTGLVWVSTPCCKTPMWTVWRSASSRWAVILLTRRVFREKRSRLAGLLGRRVGLILTTRQCCSGSTAEAALIGCSRAVKMAGRPESADLP